ncbi:hypothetical protein AB5J62_41775 [Amycolatopsis sp. cg5]|uniref:hypothetical protein n=1 Tax=Amycolatopsis sp. cg5 TaxID=3238802 RepID=UPI00352697A8
MRAAVLAVALALTAACTPQQPPGKVGFTVTDVPGRSTELYPGATGARWVRIGNAENFPIKVTSLTATVQPTSNPACRPDLVRVDPLAKALVVPKQGFAEVALTTHLAAAAPDACKNVTFPLTYTGTATKS